MWPFDSISISELEKENLKLHHEIKDLKQVIDELFSRESEQKAVYHYSMSEKEKKIEELEAKIADLEDIIDDMKQMGKRAKKTKAE
jgi:peptidoglycan hydrolase CwlO-like protein